MSSGTGGSPALSGDDFAAALRCAIAARGVSLGHLRRVLAEEGFTISTASLSYWQSGRSVPERPSSLAALGALERCLELPRGFLAHRVPGVRRDVDDPTAEYSWGPLPSVGWPSFAYVDSAVTQLGMGFDDFERVVVHDHLTVSARGARFVNVTGVVLVARVDGADRFPVWGQAEEDSVFPVVEGVLNCHVGRVREFRELSAVAAEVVLDQPVARGETMYIEYRQTFMGDRGDQQCLRRRMVSRSAEVVLEVVFDPARPPREVTAYRQVGEKREDVAVVAGPVVQAHFVDQPPGVFCVGWEY